jgi:hypothetical protein
MPRVIIINNYPALRMRPPLLKGTLEGSVAGLGECAVKFVFSYVLRSKGERERDRGRVEERDRRLRPRRTSTSPRHVVRSLRACASLRFARENIIVRCVILSNSIPVL